MCLAQKYVISKTIFSNCCSLCNPDLYTMKFQFLHHLVEYFKRFGDLLAMDGSVHENLNVHIKRTCQASPPRPETRMPRTLRSMELEQEKEQSKTAIRKVKSSLSVVIGECLTL